MPEKTQRSRNKCDWIASPPCVSKSLARWNTLLTHVLVTLNPICCMNLIQKLNWHENQSKAQNSFWLVVLGGFKSLILELKTKRGESIFILSVQIHWFFNDQRDIFSLYIHYWKSWLTLHTNITDYCSKNDHIYSNLTLSTTFCCSFHMPHRVEISQKD